MAPCLSSGGGGGGRTYGLDMEIVKSASTWSRSTTSQTSSPSSTLSDSSNSTPLAISTRKQRTPRKRPNQTYSEAAAILSTAYPTVFLSNPCKFTKPHKNNSALLHDESSDLLLPFQVFHNTGFLLHQPSKRPIGDHPKLASLSSSSSCDRSCSGGELEEYYLRGNLEELNNDFDAESMLDVGVEEGIDSIMGNLNVSSNDQSNNQMNSSWRYGYPVGLGLRLAARGVRAMRHVDEVNWWDFPIVDMLQISPRLNSNNSGSYDTTSSVPDSKNCNNNKKDKSVSASSSSKMKLKTKSSSGGDKKKKKKKVEKPKGTVEMVKEYPPSEEEEEEEVSLTPPISTANTDQYQGGQLLLKLNYDDVLNAWSDRGYPFSEEIEGSDAHARLAQIDLFTESGGVREASVMRYKEKRRTRLYSKKIRYQVRKVNADQRLRMKGRFVRRSQNLSTVVKEKEGEVF